MTEAAAVATHSQARSGATRRPSGAPSDPRLRGYLVRALGHETSAVQQYLAQAGLTGIWGLDEYCQRFRRDGVEELGHVERVMRRLLSLGVVPPTVPGQPVRLGRSLEEMLLIDRDLEVGVIRLYDEARRYSARISDVASEELFAGLLREEIEHLASIDSALEAEQAGSTRGARRG